MFLSGLKCLSRLERQVKFAKNRCCKIKPVAVISKRRQIVSYNAFITPTFMFLKFWIDSQILKFP